MVLLSRFKNPNIYEVQAKLIQDSARTLEDDLITAAYQRIIQKDERLVPPIIMEPTTQTVQVTYHPEQFCTALHTDGASEFDWKGLVFNPNAALILGLRRGEAETLPAMDTLYLRAFDERHVPTFEATIRIGNIRLTESYQHSRIWHRAGNLNREQDAVVINLLTEEFQLMLNEPQRMFIYTKAP